MGNALGPEFEVITEGHPGRTTVHDDPTTGEYRNGVRVLPALLESHKPLDMVILKLGTNDLKNCFHVSATDIAFFLDRLVRMIRAAGEGREKQEGERGKLHGVRVSGEGWLSRWRMAEGRFPEPEPEPGHPYPAADG